MVTVLAVGDAKGRGPGIVRWLRSALLEAVSEQDLKKGRVRQHIPGRGVASIKAPR